MKNYRVISLVLILLCSSCNDTSFSSSSSISNIPEVLLGKYPNMRIEMPDGIYRVESRLNSYVYEYGNYYLCSLKSVSYIDLTERNVKRLMISLAKEFADSTGFSVLDIVAALIGCATVEITLVIAISVGLLSA